MALTRTTLSAAVTADSKTVLLASITGLALGQMIRVDSEKMRVTVVPSAATIPVGVYRGVDGTNVVAHAVTSGVAFGDPGDFTPVTDPARRRLVASYGAAGAIDISAVGYDNVAIINGTAALAMTVAAPSKAADGDILIIVGNGKAAHTVTITGGLGAGGTGIDVGTFAAGGQQSIMLVAANEVWVQLPSFAGGTLTNTTVTFA